MTREEAIRELKIQFVGEYDRQREAKDMAIKALEQESCEDEYIKVPKKALKYRTAGMVAYNDEWLKNHFDIEKAVICGVPLSCDDAISRQAVLEQTYNWCKDEFLRVTNPFDYLRKRINDLQPVTPQPKVGRWIKSTGYDDRDHFYSCSECGRNINLICGAKLADYPYCHCGAKIQEVEE